MSVAAEVNLPAQHRAALGADAARLLSDTDQRLTLDLGELPALIAPLAPQRVLAVVDRTALDATGANGSLTQSLERYAPTWFEGFAPNPKHEHGVAAARAARDADLIVAFGGGSALDVAKLAALAARRPEITSELVRGERPEEADPLPIIAIPTTSGTGSEATHFAAVYVDGRKVSVGHPALRPVGTVLDVRLHETMPRELAAVTGLDALSQALESSWAVGSTAASRQFAAVAGQLILQWLELSANRGTREARFAMMIGAHLAGQAINLSKTTAAHALSYQFTQRLGLAHGHAVALTLGSVGAANACVDAENCLDPRGPEHVKDQVQAAADLFGIRPQDLPLAIRELLERLNLPSTLAAAGVDERLLAECAAAVDPVRLRNNPRRFSRAELADLLRATAGSTATPAAR